MLLLPIIIKLNCSYDFQTLVYQRCFNARTLSVHSTHIYKLRDKLNLLGDDILSGAFTALPDSVPLTHTPAKFASQSQLARLTKTALDFNQQEKSMERAKESEPSLESQRLNAPAVQPKKSFFDRMAHFFRQF